MKTRIFILRFAVVLAASILGNAAHAARVTDIEARQAAENWLREVLVQRGSWGEHERAEIRSMEPMVRDGRLLGYIFQVDPVGFIAVSPLRELAPIRAYSVRSNLDLQEEEGGAAVFAGWQASVHRAIEAALGRPIDPADELGGLLSADFDVSWRQLLDPAFVPRPDGNKDRSRGVGIDYEEGDEMLYPVSWAQGPPYNDQCPGDECEFPENGYYNDNCVVGCVATAGAMIMRYWNWPPTGVGSGYDMSYDWPNMGHMYSVDSTATAWIGWDGVWNHATQAEVDAVALISRKVGQAVSMNYGCGGSSAQTYDLQGAFQYQFRYHPLSNHAWREDYTFMEWVSLLIGEFSNNRPVAYRIEGHAIVLDGWDEDLGDYYFHVVYGGNGSWDGWFTLGEIHNAGPTDEQYVVYKLCPEGVIGLPQSYYDLPAYPYRYLERDLTTPGTEFAAGHNFQILKPGFLATGATGGDYSLRFNGAPGLETAFYQQGDPANKTRIRIKDGAMKFMLGGQMAIY